MNQTTKSGIDLVHAWPNQAEASAMLGISESTLSRRQDLQFDQVGARERRYRPALVLEAAAFYKRRSLNAIAAQLLAYASDHGSDLHYSEVKKEIDAFFASRDTPAVDRERFLREAKRALPRHLFREVERAFDQGVVEEPEVHGEELELETQQFSPS